MGRFLSVAVFLITAGSLRRSQGLKSSSINPRTEEGQVRYVLEILKLGIFFHHKTVGSDYFEALSVFSISVDVSPQKSGKFPIKLWHHEPNIPF